MLLRFTRAGVGDGGSCIVTIPWNCHGLCVALGLFLGFRVANDAARMFLHMLPRVQLAEFLGGCLSVELLGHGQACL